MGSARVHIAVLSISPANATAVAIESALADAVTAGGHDLTAFEVVRDSEVAIRAQLVGWIADPDVDVVIILAGGEATAIALAPLVDQSLPGFADLLRVLSDQAGAIYNDAEVVRCDTKFVFVLPAHANAVRAVMEHLILPQLDARTEKNLLASLPRLSEATRVDVSTIDASLAAEARNLPGRARKPTGKNVIARKVDDPTKPIDLEKLEHQLALSKNTDQVTRSIDLDKLQHQLEATRSVGDTTKPMDLGKSAIPMRSKHPIGIAKSPSPAPAAQPARAKSASTPPPSASPARPRSPSGPLPSVVARSDASERSAPMSSTIGTRKVSPASPAEPAPRGRPATGSPPPSAASTATTAPYPAQGAPIASTATTAPYPAQPAPPGTSALHPARPTPDPSTASTTAISPTPASSAPAASSASTTSTAPTTSTASTTPAAPTTSTTSTTPETTTPRRSTGTTPPPAADLAEPADWVETIDPDELHEESDVVEPPVSERPQPIPVASPAAAPSPSSPASAAPSPAPKSAPSSAPPSFAELAPTAYADDSFEVPSLRRSRTPLVLGLLLLALVLGGGAYLFMNRGDDTKPEQVAQTSPDAAEPGAASTSQPEADAAVVAAVTIDAAEPEPAPEIEIEPESVASKPAPDVERKKPRRDRKSKTKPDTEPDQPDEPDTANTVQEPKPPPSVPGCEEVECVLEKYKRPCCARYKPTGEGFEPSTVPAENLQKTQIKAGIAKVRGKVMSCGEQFPTKGTVKLSITVDPDGKITELDVVTSPDDALGSCVAAAVRTATFPKTEGGGSFNQPFVF